MAAAVLQSSAKDMLAMTPPQSAEMSQENEKAPNCMEENGGANGHVNGNSSAADAAETQSSPQENEGSGQRYNAKEVQGMTVEQLEQRMEALRLLYQKHLKELSRYTPNPEDFEDTKPVRAAAEAAKQAAAESRSKALEAKAAAANRKEEAASKEAARRAEVATDTVQRRSNRAPKPTKQFVIEEDNKNYTDSLARDARDGPTESNGSESGRTRKDSASAGSVSTKSVKKRKDDKDRKRDKDKDKSKEKEKTDEQPLKRARRSSVARSRASAEEGVTEEEEGEGQIFECPWPGCKRVFDRVKSRSAHLKWHGGSYKEEKEKADALAALEEEASAMDASIEDVDDLPAGSKRPSTNEDYSNDPVAKKRALCELEIGQLVQIADNADVKFTAFRGKQGSVEAVGKVVDEELTYSILFNSKSRGRTTLIPRSSLEVVTDGETEVGGLPLHLAVGQVVLGQTEVDKDNVPLTYKRGQIIALSMEGKQTMYVFQSQEDGSKPQSLSSEEILVDSPAVISELKVGDRICATMSGKPQTTFHTGIIQRLEPSRARINYDGFPVAWRKASDIRALGEE